MREDVKRLQKFIQESNNIVFFGGAGVSTESGIPDFRSKDGLYNQKDVQFEQFTPEYLLSHDCLYRDTKVFYEFYRQKMDTRSFKPNITHKVLAKLERMGKLKAVVTQNIDSLHQRGGSQTVYEIHGSTDRNYCDKCKKEYDGNFIFDCGEEIPRCPVCGGLVRPDVTLYGEMLPEDAVRGAQKAIRKADMLIVAGTSLRVYPAASYVYDFAGKHLVVINKEPLDIHMPGENLIITGAMGEIFEELDNVL